MDEKSKNLIRASIDQNLEESLAAHQASTALSESLAEAVLHLTHCLMNNGKILICGNGGSAADAQHLAAELVGRFEKERHGLAAIALTTDPSIITSLSNDYGYEHVFARQVSALGNTGDVLVAFSTSGNSPSIIGAIHAAHEADMTVLAMTGGQGGAMAAALSEQDYWLNAPIARTARIQEIHTLILHCLCDGIDTLFLGDSSEG